ncbi:MAG: cob(I)yrinic acid a,c-diamide adenosyltransferase [Candidatus Heimdallarchaeota archaeon]|nr:cob(I)yrinic acid a,c-diamide adenosyltransferase [Candidatus Heimdallarchaeota archaeon]
MKEIFLTHYYYGDRFTSFKTGLGTIIRGLGHSLNIRMILINDSFHWLTNQDQFKNIDAVFLDLNQHKEILRVLQEEILSLEKSLLFIANFDLLIEHNILSIEDFIDLIKSKHKTTEILLTGEMKYPKLENIADYVSAIQSTKN